MKFISDILCKGINTEILTGVFILCSMLSCSSREENPGAMKIGPDSVLRFKINGIEEIGSTVPISNAEFNQGMMPQSSVRTQENTLNFRDFDVLTSMEASTENKKGKIAAKASVVTVADQGMTPGVKYRILIYRAGTMVNPVADVVATVGIDPQIAVDSGQAYDWYVVSTNDSSTPPTVIDGVIKSNSISNKDVLYARSLTSVTPYEGETDLGIIFHHYTARLDVNLNTRGVFGRIDNTTTVEVGTGIGANFNNIAQTGDLNIFTGTYSNLQPIAPVKGSDMVNTAGSGGDIGASKTAIFYTVNLSPIPADNLRVRLGTLGVILDDVSTHTFSNTLITYNNTVINPAIGHQYGLNARIVESGITVGTTVWARTNLHYAEYATDTYRFLPHNDVKIGNLINLLNIIQLGEGKSSGVKPLNLYWNWNSLLPEGTPGSGDPCGKVYPEGNWKTPTQTQLNALGKVPSDGIYTETPLLGTAHYAAKWKAPATLNTIYPIHSRQLFLPIYGYRSGSQIYNSAGALLSGVVGSAAFNYWSSEGDTTNGIAYTGEFNIVLGILSLNGSLSGVSTMATRGMSVRCVKSVNAPAS